MSSHPTNKAHYASVSTPVLLGMVGGWLVLLLLTMRAQGRHQRLVTRIAAIEHKRSA